MLRPGWLSWYPYLPLDCQCNPFTRGVSGNEKAIGKAMITKGLPIQPEPLLFGVGRSPLFEVQRTGASVPSSWHTESRRTRLPLLEVALHSPTTACSTPNLANRPCSDGGDSHIVLALGIAVPQECRAGFEAEGASVLPLPVFTP